MFFSGVFAHAAYAVLIPRLRLGEDIAAAGFGVMLSATAVLLVAFWPRVIATDWMGLSKLTWIILIYLAVMSTVLTFALIAFAASRLPSAKVTAIPISHHFGWWYWTALSGRAYQHLWYWQEGCQ